MLSPDIVGRLADAETATRKAFLQPVIPKPESTEEVHPNYILRMMRTLLQNGHGSMLTFGLEVEFFAAMKVPTLSRFPVGHIIGLVGDRLSFIRLHGPDGHGARVMVEGDNEEPDGQLDYSCWNITTSMTVAANHPDWFLSYDTQGVEIVSPPYWIYSPLWEQDVQRVFTTQLAQFNPIPCRELQLYCEQNSSTSLHVHIGNGTHPEAAFPFHTIRNLAAILLIYEPELDRLLDTSPSWNRRADDPIRSITPTKSPHFQPPNLPPNSPRAIMAIYILNTCATIQDIIDAMNPPLPPAVNPREPQYFKYNFIPLLDSVRTPKHAKDEFQGGRLPKRKHPTVEFRQQPGTLDPDTMVHYIRLLGAIVHLAGSIGLESLKEFLGVEDWRWINHSGYRSNSESSSSSADSQHESTHPNISQPSLSAFSLLSNLQPVGSFARLLTAMEVAHIPLDENTMRFWCRKVRTGSPRAII